MTDTSSAVSRRTLFAGLAATPVLAAAPAAAQMPAAKTAAEQAQAALKDAKGTKLVLLGTAGAPVPGRSRQMTSHVMLSNGSAYVLDCGMGVTDQYARTGIPFSALKSIFITHHHADHNIEYGPLLVVGWINGMHLDVRAFGPPPLKQMTEDFLRAYKTTVDFWAEDLKMTPLVTVDVKEVSAAGPVIQDDNVKVSAIIVEHPPVKPALAYRFESLAAAQHITARPMPRRSLALRLRDNAAVLLEAYRTVGRVVGDGRATTPAAEWLLDNYHVVEDQIREIRDDLPPGYYRQLPKLADGPFAGYPRVFGIAWAFVAHTDSHFDPDMLCRFVRAYQRVQPLTIGELWAVAITLRIVLVENLRRAAKRIVSGRAERQEADALADRLLGVNGNAAEPVALVLQRYEQAPLPEAFAVQLVQRLRDQDPDVVPALVWLEGRLTAQGTTAEEIVRDQHQRQAATNVTTRNIITSMRLVSDVDWTELVESVSLVDEVLQSGSDFASMDFPTRNLYRSAIEGEGRGRFGAVPITDMNQLVPIGSTGPVNLAGLAAVAPTDRGE